MKHETLIVFGLIAISLAAFAGVGQCGFVNYDDPVYVVNNPHVTTGISSANFAWAWRTLDNSTYVPLTWVSLMLNATLFGAAPSGFHWVNLAFHIANALLVYLFFRQATGAIWRSALVSAIFAVHPLRVESVAWIVERKDVLSSFFGLLTMLAYLHYTRALKWTWYGATLVLFAASLLAKQSLTSFPFLLLLLDYWPLGRWAGGPDAVACNNSTRRSLPQLVFEKLPLLMMVAAISVVTIRAHAAMHGGSAIETLPWAWRLTNVPVSYARYLGRMVWFGNLAVFYYRHYWGVLDITGACLLLASITAICLSKLRSRPWLTVGWFWFLGVLVPMIGIIDFGNHAMADRFSYFSGIGVSLMLVWSIPATVWQKPPLVLAAVGLALSVLIVFSIAQTRYWHDTVTLFSRSVAVADSQTAELNLGAALFERGQRSDGVRHLEKAVTLNPRTAATQGALAQALANTHKPAEALPHCMAAIQSEPNNAQWRVALAFILNQEDRYDLSAEQSRIAIALDPLSAQGHRLLGLSLCEMGKIDDGIEQLKLALSISPDFKDAQLNLKRFQAPAEKSP